MEILPGKGFFWHRSSVPPPIPVLVTIPTALQQPKTMENGGPNKDCHAVGKLYTGHGGKDRARQRQDLTDVPGLNNIKFNSGSTPGNNIKLV